MFLLYSVYIGRCFQWNGKIPFLIFTLAPKLYIPISLDIWEKLLTPAFWEDKNRLVAGRFAFKKNLKTIFYLYFNPEFSIKFWIYFHSKNSWFQPFYWGHNQLYLLEDVIHCLEYLGYLTLSCSCMLAYRHVQNGIPIYSGKEIYTAGGLDKFLSVIINKRLDFWM